MTTPDERSLILAVLLLCAAPAAAEGWAVKVKIMNGRLTYSHTQPLTEGKQSSYSGKCRVQGGGPARDLLLHNYLFIGEEAPPRLDYQVELAGERGVRPPFQAAGKLQLRPGKPALAAEAGGWRLVLELQGGEGREFPRPGRAELETSLKCGRAAYPASFSYLPDEQYTAVLYRENDGEVNKFMVGLLPNAPGALGAFRLQYTLQLKEAGETLADGQGELLLEPGGPRRTAAAGKGCVFSARALR